MAYFIPTNARGRAQTLLLRSLQNDQKVNLNIKLNKQLGLDLKQTKHQQVDYSIWKI